MPNKTEPNTLARLVENMRFGVVHAMANVTNAPEAKDFPCSLCGGKGILIKSVCFATFEQPQTFLKKGDGRNIVAREVCNCPTCYGTGVDDERLAKYVHSIGNEVTPRV